MIAARLARPSFTQSLRLGAIAGTAYLAEQAFDRRLAPNQYDDLVLWGGFFTSNRGAQRILGLAGHYALSAALAAAFLAARPMLPGRSPGLQATLFVMAEHLLSFPTVAVGERIHPAVGRGQLPALATRQYFHVETARHAAYALALGLAVPKEG